MILCSVTHKSASILYKFLVRITLLLAPFTATGLPIILPLSPLTYDSQFSLDDGLNGLPPKSVDILTVLCISVLVISNQSAQLSSACTDHTLWWYWDNFVNYYGYPDPNLPNLSLKLQVIISACFFLDSSLG